MDPIRFAVIGSGWRSLFYWRIARAYPNLFEMTAMLCRTEEKAEKMRREHGITAVTTEKEIEEKQPEFVVVAVNKASICEVSIHWMKKGYPVLCETPAALTLEELHTLWQLHKEQGMKLQVAEQYFLYPSFAAGIAAVRKYLTDPYVIDISAAHDYHGASLIRRYLDVGMEPMTLWGKCYRYPVEETDSRYGPVTDGSVKMRERVRMTFEFASGKTAFYDFDGVQYHSFIRGRHLRVQAQCGELDDDRIRYVDGDHKVHELKLEYENPFKKYGEGKILTEDETAIGVMLLGMRDYIENGTEVYPLAEALQDAYVRILMSEALDKTESSDEGHMAVVRSEIQPWN